MPGRARQLVDTGPAGTIADVAARSGGADHSHLARSSAGLTGVPPTGLAAGPKVAFRQDEPPAPD